jgi:hypothetical protein
MTGQRQAGELARMGLVSVQVIMPLKLRQSCKVIAALRDVPLRVVYVDALKEYVAAHEPKGPVSLPAIDDDDA